jgi:EAL domain-containing protein (putative c-di-GMP-specific phosphodiesterase class I)/GGDEF domain-containing protein
MTKLIISLSQPIKWLFTSALSILLLLVLFSFTTLLTNIDELLLSKNSKFTYQSSYYIDTKALADAQGIINNADFTLAALNKIPYELADQSYWIRLKLYYPTSSKQLTTFYGNIKNIVLLAEHSNLKTFKVFELDKNENTKLVFDLNKVKDNVIDHIYPHTNLLLSAHGQSDFLIHVKNIGPPNIPLLLFTPQDFETRALLTQIVYGAFIGAIFLMALYNMVLFFAVKDKVYLFYISYLVSAFIVLSSLTGFGHVLFSSAIVSWINQQLIFFHFCLTLFLLLFTLYFLRYNIGKSKLFILGIVSSVIFFAAAIYSLFISEILQAKLFFSLQPLFYLVALYLILTRLKSSFSWARFYFISWLPLLIGAVIQPLVLLNYLDYSFINRNAFLLAIMVEITFMAFALAERMRRNDQDKLAMMAYHQNTLLPRKSNLAHTLQNNINVNNHNLSVLVIKPEQYNQIDLYIDDEANALFFRQVSLRLSSLFKFNDAILPLTDKLEKLCFLEHNCLALLLNNNKNKQSIELIVQSIQSCVAESYVINNLKLPLAATVGVANYTDHGIDSDMLINNATVAANSAEKNNAKWAFFQQSKAQLDSDLMRLAIDIVDTISQKGFELFHQPQIDLKTQKVCSSECLIRWQHPEKGAISPELFIPVAEDFGLINKITLWVIETALAQQLRLREQHGFNHMISINISGKDIIAESFFENVSEIILRSGIKPEKIIFELTESSSFTHNAMALKTVEKLITLGISISIDDFGTGYSSMAQISDLPFHELKVDRQFVENVCDDKKRYVIAKATVEMAKGLGLEVVAEGINSKLDEDTLRDFGCDIGQGYYYAKPMSIDDYIHWLESLTNGKTLNSIEGEFIPADK